MESLQLGAKAILQHMSVASVTIGKKVVYEYIFTYNSLLLFHRFSDLPGVRTTASLIFAMFLASWLYSFGGFSFIMDPDSRKMWTHLRIAPGFSTTATNVVMHTKKSLNSYYRFTILNKRVVRLHAKFIHPCSGIATKRSEICNSEPWRE